MISVVDVNITLQRDLGRLNINKQANINNLTKTNVQQNITDVSSGQSGIWQNQLAKATQTESTQCLTWTHLNKLESHTVLFEQCLRSQWKKIMLKISLTLYRAPEFPERWYLYYLVCTLLSCMHKIIPCSHSIINCTHKIKKKISFWNFRDSLYHWKLVSSLTLLICFY